MKRKGLIYIGIMTIIMFFAGSIIYFTNNESSYNPVETVAVTIDEKQIYLDEVLYHLTLSKMQGQLYAAFMNDKDYMSRDYGDGRTIGEVMKQEAMNNTICYELLYKKAIEEGYTLTEEEMIDSRRRTEDIQLTIPKEEQKLTGLTEDKLLQIQEKIVLASKYYETVYADEKLTNEEIYKQLGKEHQITIKKKVWDSIKF